MDCAKTNNFQRNLQSKPDSKAFLDKSKIYKLSSHTVKNLGSVTLTCPCRLVFQEDQNSFVRPYTSLTRCFQNNHLLHSAKYLAKNMSILVNSTLVPRLVPSVIPTLHASTTRNGFPTFVPRRNFVESNQAIH